MNWAEIEIDTYCKRTKNEYNADCAKSALKAYKLLEEDGHSGNSWNVTKNILMRLMDGKPLTPITEEDFNDVDSISLQENVKQCPRMSGLFRTEHKDGTVTYNDVNRATFIDKHCGSKVSWHSGLVDKIVDEMFPITLPYSGSEEYVMYGESFMERDYKEHGSYDTVGYYELHCPDGSIIQINRFYKEVDNNMVEITRKEFMERLNKSKS